MKVVSVVGARPQFIKIAVLSAELRSCFREVLVHTGQHYDYEMSDVFFQGLGIPAPDYHLGVGSGGHGAQTGQMLAAIEQVLEREQPQMVVVIGDTNSTLAGALAAAKMRIPVAHVEAGLRSYTDMPEEINRRLTDHMSQLLFAPTERACEALYAESVPGAVHHVGDVLVEALERARESGAGHSILEKEGLAPASYWLVTLHRAELTDDREMLRRVLHNLDVLGPRAVFPMHPRTRAAVDRFDLWHRVPATVKVIPPVSFFEMLSLERNAIGIVTDSGGVQRESYLLGVPCFTCRGETEWGETLADGWNRLVGRDAAGLPAALAKDRSSRAPSPVFGDRLAAHRIVQVMATFLDGETHPAMDVLQQVGQP